MSSKLGDCNSLFLSHHDFELQLVQNSLCRVVTRSSKFSHITPQLKKLYWLPVGYRVQFKIGLITYKILNQGQPVYLRELIQPYTSSRNTRCSTPKLKFLHTPTFDHRVHKTNTFLILSVTTPQFLELFPLPNKKWSLCLIFQETPQNPPLQFQFPNLVSFPRLSLLKMIFVY